MTATRHLELWADDSHTFSMPVYGNLSTITLIEWWVGKAANATGADVPIRKSSADPTQIRKIAQSDDRWVIEIKIEPSDTANMRVGEWYHEMRFTDGYDNQRCFMIGTFTLHQTMIR
jgi:hypothetical protein